MTTTEKLTPPECCPVCQSGQNVVKRQTETQRVFDCGSVWGLSEASGGIWFRDCPNAMAAAVRCGATLTGPTLPPTVAALVAALFAERKAWQKLAALTVGDDTSADACLLACQERDAAAEVLDDAAIAYLATVTP